MMIIGAFWLAVVFAFMQRDAFYVQARPVPDELSSLPSRFFFDKLIKYGYLSADAATRNLSSVRRALDLFRLFNTSQTSLMNESGRCGLPDLVNTVHLTKQSSTYDAATPTRGEQKLRTLSFGRRTHDPVSGKRLDSSSPLLRSVLTYMPADLSADKMVEYQIMSWWSRRRLKWSLLNHPASSLTYAETRDAFARAFQLWSNVTSLQFMHLPTERGDIDAADIRIEFSSFRQHDAACPYKFIDSTLAHAFYPERGWAHFNADKQWTLDDANFVRQYVVSANDAATSDSKTIFNGNANVKYQYNLLTVAAHEIGHLLGLGHSSNRRSVMYPEYKSSLNEFKFDSYDLEAIHFLYGTPEDRMFKYSRRNRHRNQNQTSSNLYKYF